MSIFHKLRVLIKDIAYIWRKEMWQVIRDEGVFMFFVVVPLAVVP